MKFGQTFQGHLPPEIWRRKNVKFRRDFGQLRDLIVNIPGKQEDVRWQINDDDDDDDDDDDVVNRKMALQTTDT